MNPPHVGFIGLGSQGGPMARRIVDAGFALTLWARRAETLLPFENTNAHTADSLESLGAECDVICICVVNDEGVNEVCNLLLPAMQKNSVLVIHSTIDPNNCRALAERAARFNVGVVDAPVSGGGPAAERGELTVMLGGEPEPIARVMPLLRTYAGLISRLGGVGAGQTAKLINNNLMAAQLGLVHSAAEIGVAEGLDRNALLSLIKASSGRSFAAEVYDRMPSPGAFHHGAALLAKDVALLADTCQDRPDQALLKQAADAFLDAVRNDVDTR